MIQGNYGFSPQYSGVYGQYNSQFSTSSAPISSNGGQLEQLQQLIASLSQSSSQLRGQWGSLLGASSGNNNGSISNQFPPPPPPFQGQNGQFGGQFGQLPPPPPFQGQNGQFGGQFGQLPPPPHFQGQGNNQNNYDLASILRQLGINS